MLKRMLHAANTVLTKEQTVEGIGEVILRDTVNEPAHLVEVHGRSEQKVQEQGKNLLDDTEAYFMNASSNMLIRPVPALAPFVFDGDKRAFGFVIRVKPNTEYTFKMNGIEAQGLGQQIICTTEFAEYGNWDFYNLVLQTNVGDDTVIFTTTNSTHAILCGVWFYPTPEAGTKISFENAQLELGSVATDYEPFRPAMPSPEYPSEIRNAGGKLASNGWNLFDREKMIEFSTGKNQIMYIPITLKPNTAYVFRDNYGEWNGKGVFLSIRCGGNTDDTSHNVANIVDSNLGNRKEYIFITNESTMYYLRFWKDPMNEILSLASEIELKEFCNKDTSYDCYRGSSITLPALRSIPDGIEDVLRVDGQTRRAWVERKVNEYKVTGRENEFIFTSGVYDRGSSTNVAIDTSHNVHAIKGGSNKAYLCNCLKHVSSVWNTNGAVGYCVNVNQIHLRFPNTLLGVADDDDSNAKKQAWINYVRSKYDSGNPITVCAPLENPVIEELPYEPLLMSQYYTSITAESEVQPMISVNCLKICGGGVRTTK